MEQPNKYAKAKIYKIVDNAYTDCYIGSTVQSLSTRMASHRRWYKSYKAGNTNYVTVYALFDLHGIDNCKIELVEEYPCESIEQLSKREGYYIKRGRCVNKNIAGRSTDEWYQDNKERVNEKVKSYYEANKERKKANNKKYYEANREQRLVYGSQWGCKTVECPICNKTLTRFSLNRHKKTLHPDFA